MRAAEFTHQVDKKLRTYLVRLRLPGPGPRQFMDTTVQASSPQMVRRMLRAQYNDPKILVGQPRVMRA